MQLNSGLSDRRLTTHLCWQTLPVSPQTDVPENKGNRQISWKKLVSAGCYWESVAAKGRSSYTKKSVPSECKEHKLWDTLVLPCGWRTGCTMTTAPGEVAFDNSTWRSLPLCLLVRQMDRVSSSLQYTKPWRTRETLSRSGIWSSRLHWKMVWSDFL